jgi:histone acetyltransferase MYST1
MPAPLNTSLVPASVLERRPDEVYVHYADTDKRLDEWVPESTIRLTDVKSSNPGPRIRTNGAGLTKKRKRSTSSAVQDGEEAKEVKLSEEEYDIEHHKQITAKRNFDKVNFGRWQIKTWCVVWLYNMLFIL